jgi:predicted nucleotidyltransferase
VRLSDFEISAIRKTVSERDVDARVYLFGSRVDDARRGGDIDLLIMSDLLTSNDRGAIRWRLWELIGEQKIDIIIAKDTSDPFTRIAFQQGELL